MLAFLGSVFPLGYALGRAVSILAIIASALAMWRAVSREGKDSLHAAIAVGLFLSAYVFSYRWLDVARADSLFLAFLLWALVILRESWGNPRKALLAGLLMAAAFWTKQTAFVFVLASGVGALFVAPRQLWIYAGSIALVAGGGVWLGSELTDGWLWTYIYELHQSHAFNRERFTHEDLGDVPARRPLCGPARGGRAVAFLPAVAGEQAEAGRRGLAPRQVGWRIVA